MMNTDDNETAAKTSASLGTKVPPGAKDDKEKDEASGVADDKDKDAVAAPFKEKKLTLGEMVPASGEADATINITGAKQQDSEGAETASAIAKATADWAQAFQQQQEQRKMQTLLEFEQLKQASIDELERENCCSNSRNKHC